MADAHIEMVRRACEAWCEGDISVYREMYAPDVVADPGGLWPEGERAAEGIDAVMSTFESILAVFERSELIPEDFHSDGDALVAALLWRGAIPGADAPIEQRIACAYRFKDGLIAYTAWFAELSEATAAVGLTLSADGSAEAGASAAGL
jgi:ketosteroid isomerase-like protein